VNELLSDTRFWLIALGTGILGLVRYLFVKHTSETKERLDKLESDAVRRSEFDQLREDMNQRHEQNTKKLDDIMETATGTHRRIDDLYRDLMRDKGTR
jgi:hypothetical protein